MHGAGIYFTQLLSVGNDQRRSSKVAEAGWLDEARRHLGLRQRDMQAVACTALPVSGVLDALSLPGCPQVTTTHLRWSKKDPVLPFYEVRPLPTPSFLAAASCLPVGGRPFALALWPCWPCAALLSALLSAVHP